MVIYFGADHRGFALKETLREYVKSVGYEAYDLGATEYDKDDDYPDFARAVAEKVGKDAERSRGILVCGSGVGMDIVANKFRGVRAALMISPDQVYSGRHDDDANVLVLASDITSEADAKKGVQVFLETPFGGDARYMRRLEKVMAIENRE